MSFAVCAVIAPSRCLRCLLAAFCATLIATALAVGLYTPERFAFGGLVAFAPLAAGVALGCSLRHAWWRLPPSAAGQGAGAARLLLCGSGTPRHLDISGLGQLRLTVQEEIGAQAGAPGSPAPGRLFALLPGATVWPCCMFLGLRDDDGVAGSLLLLPDSMSNEQYRSMSVAVRALASRTTDTTSTQNTLNLLQEINS